MRCLSCHLVRLNGQYVDNMQFQTFYFASVKVRPIRTWASRFQRLMQVLISHCLDGPSQDATLN